MNPYYEKDGITIYYGDCRDVLPTIGDGLVDLVLTDPPYGVGKAEWDGEFPTYWIAEAARVAPRMLVMSGNRWLIKAGAALPDYRDCIALWAKNGMTRSPIAFGNFIPVLASGDWKWESRPNLLPFVVNAEERIDHPSPKPLSAMVALFYRYTKPGWKILDPFLGSGTTLVAAKQNGCSAIGIEIEERYCEIAAKRLDQSVLPFAAVEEDAAKQGVFDGF